MVNAKRLDNLFIFLFFVLFPLGQIIRIGILKPLDIVVGMGAIYALIKKYEKPSYFIYLRNFLIAAAASWVISLFIFKTGQVFYGFLYLLRLWAYIYFIPYVRNFIKINKENAGLLLNSLLAVSVVVAIFGWIQFFWFPDLRPFFPLGWDEHLYRLFGTFLDPAFLSLIIVFGLLLAIQRSARSFSGANFSIMAFLLITLAFTYSRAGYLAFLAGAGFLLYRYKLMKYFAALFGVLLIIVVALPTSQNKILSFTRQFSAIARINNYVSTAQIFSRSPVFGVGYDNMCLAYRTFIGEQSFLSHSCSGSDSSLLFILATTGVVGFMTFVFGVKFIAGGLVRNSNYNILVACAAAAFVHSLFSNSLFYPWIMGYLVILLSLAKVYDEDETLFRKV